MSWSNIHKWVVRYCDEEQPNFTDLNRIIDNEGIYSLTGNGNNSLHFAALGKSAAVLSYLFKFEKLVNKCNYAGESPLHWACKAGILKNVKLLLAQGANADQVDTKGNSILHFAVESGNRELIKYLLKTRTTSVNVTNNFGSSALQVACEEQEFRLIKYLVANGCETRSVIQRNLNEDNTKAVKYIIRAKKANRGKTC